MSSLELLALGRQASLGRLHRTHAPQPPRGILFCELFGLSRQVSVPGGASPVHLLVPVGVLWIQLLALLESLDGLVPTT